MSKSRFAVPHGVVSLVVMVGLAAAVHRASADAPPGLYGAATSGTVTDTRTGLIWQQAAPSTTLTWSNATAYCGSNVANLPGSRWRLPTMTELQTLIDDSQSSGTMIDPHDFQGTPAAQFWTSSLDANTPGAIWIVDFKFGFTSSIDQTTQTYLRCVR